MADLIDRQAAIDALCSKCTVDKPETCSTIQKGDTWCEEVHTLQKVPSVQPERKKGEWIEISSINHTYKCSECGRLLVNVSDGKNNVSKHYPYCHCGADMRGEKDE